VTVTAVERPCSNNALEFNANPEERFSWRMTVQLVAYDATIPKSVIAVTSVNVTAIPLCSRRGAVGYCKLMQSYASKSHE
jgi:hypothetical protein